MNMLFKYSKTILILLFKFFLSVSAFYIISKKITFNPKAYLAQGNLNFFLLALGVVVVMILLQSWRWKNILKVFATNLSFRQCLVAVWFGHLMNNLMPTASGGDLIRSYSLRYMNTKQGRWKWLGAFFSEKYSAATSALFLACLSLLSSISTKLPMVLMLFVLALLLALVLLPLVGNKVASIFPFQRFKKIFATLREIATLLANTFMNANGRYAFFASFLINLGMCIIFYAIAHAIGVLLPFTQCMFVVPVFTLLATLPISFAGWGVRELSCVGLLGFFGVSSESAVVVSVMYGLVILLSSVPGIVVAYPFLSSMYRLRKNAAYS